MAATTRPPSAASGPDVGPTRVRDPDRARAWVLALVVVAAVFVWTRFTGLDRSLWWDEAFTAHHYVRGGGATLLDPERYVANNHVLYTFLTLATARVLGTAEWVLRLWAAIPAVLAGGWLTAALWRRNGPVFAVITLTVLTASPFAAQLTTEARGYGLVVLAATVVLTLVVVQARQPTLWGDLTVAGAGLVGMLTFPPFVAVYLVHTGVWLLTRAAHRVRLVVVTAAAGAVTAAVLAPLLPAMFAGADRVGSRLSEPVNWTSPVVAPLRILGGASLQPVTAGHLGLAVVLAVALGVLGLVTTAFRDRELAIHLVAGLAGAIGILGVIGFHLVDRYLLALLPHVVVALAAGIVAVLHLLPGPRTGARVTVAGLLVAAVLLALGVPAAQRSTGVPMQEFAGASADIISRDPTAVLVRRLHAGYAWYLDGQPVERASSAEELEERFCDGERPVVYAPHPDMEPEGAPPSCLDEARRFELPQLRDPGYIHWYVLE